LVRDRLAEGVDAQLAGKHIILCPRAPLRVANQLACVQRIICLRFSVYLIMPLLSLFLTSCPYHHIWRSAVTICPKRARKHTPPCAGRTHGALYRRPPNASTLSTTTTIQMLLVDRRGIESKTRAIGTRCSNQPPIAFAKTH